MAPKTYRTFVQFCLGAGLASAVAGCAEPAFSAHLRDNNVDDINRAMAASKESASARAPMAYLVTAGDKHLVAYDLQSAQVKWDVAADVTSRVAAGRGFIAHRQGKDQIVVRSSDSGAVRCAVSLRSDEQFLGAAADTRLYYVTQRTTADARVSAVYAVSSDGCVPLWRDEAPMSMGAPAARGEVVAVPYAYQNVVLLDGKSGTEVARVRATDTSLSFVRGIPEGLFYGDDKGVYALDPKSAEGSKKGSAYAEAHLASSQIRTFFYWDAYQPSQADYTAFDRNRLLWRADANGGSVAFAGDQAILHSYRYFFAFDSRTGVIRWAYSHPRVDLVASDDTGPAVVYVSNDGDVGALDAKTGAAVWVKKTGLKVAGATFDADGFTPPDAAKVEAPPVLKTLADIVTDPDSRFTAVKVFAISSMAKQPGQAVTELLVKTVTKEGVAPPVANAAAEALIARKDVEARAIYRQALSVRSDYLNDQRPHGVDVLARVVAAIGDTDSVPLLSSHLMDPATPLRSLGDIVGALVTLGGPASIDALRDFLLAYRADTGFNQDPTPLQIAADGLLKLDGAEGRRLSVFVAEEGRTLPALAAYIHRALEGPSKTKPRADVAPTAPHATASK